MKILLKNSWFWQKTHIHPCTHSTHCNSNNLYQFVRRIKICPLQIHCSQQFIFFYATAINLREIEHQNHYQKNIILLLEFLASFFLAFLIKNYILLEIYCAIPVVIRIIKKYFFFGLEAIRNFHDLWCFEPKRNKRKSQKRH